MAGKTPTRKIGNVPIDTNKTGVMRILGITRSRLSDYLALGMPKNDDDTYHVRSIVSWYKNETTITARGKSNQFVDSTERIALAKAEKLERENKIEDGTKVDIDEVRSAFEFLSMTVANAFESMGARLANQAAAMDDPAEVQKLIWLESREVRRMLADKFERYAVGEE